MITSVPDKVLPFAANHHSKHTSDNRIVVPCPVCKGKCKVVVLGSNRSTKVCDTCKGEGKIDVTNDLGYWSKLWADLKQELVEIKLRELEIMRLMDNANTQMVRITQDCFAKES